MPGKYSSFKGQLTKFSGEPEYQDRVNKKKEEIQGAIIAQGKTPNPTNFGATLVEARLEKQRLEDLVKAQNLIIEAMNQTLVELLESENYSSLKLNNGVSLSIKDDVYCTVVNKKQFYDWIEETGQQDLLTVNYQTMSSITKSNLIAGEPIPPGIGTYFKQSISVRGAGKNDEE